MKTLLTLLLVALALTGCASTEYAQYAKSAEAASVARSSALTEIAKSGDSSAKVAAVMALALGAGNTQLQAPAPNAALQWASILVPGLTQIAGIAANVKLGTVQSNNATATAISTTSAFVGIAGMVQAPAAPQANISTVTTTSTDSHAVDSHAVSNANQTLSGTGTLGSGAYSDSNDTTTPAPVITPVVQVVPTVITPVTVTEPVVQIVPVFAPAP